MLENDGEGVPSLENVDMSTLIIRWANFMIEQAMRKVKSLLNLYDRQFLAKRTQNNPQLKKILDKNKDRSDEPQKFSVFGIIEEEELMDKSVSSQF